MKLLLAGASVYLDNASTRSNINLSLVSGKHFSSGP